MKIPKMSWHEFIQLYFSTKGRVPRLTIWLHPICYILFAILVLGICSVFVSEESKFFSNVSIILVLGYNFLKLQLCIKRIHDRNKSGVYIIIFYLGFFLLLYIALIAELWVFYLLIPSYLFLMIALLFFKGTEGNNKYGPDPCPEGKGFTYFKN